MKFEDIVVVSDDWGDYRERCRTLEKKKFVQNQSQATIIRSSVSMVLGGG